MHRLVDIDETRFYLKLFGTKYGRGHTSYRVRYPVYYKKNESKDNGIMSIEAGNGLVPQNVDGSVEQPRRWVYITQEPCDQFNFGGFCKNILTKIEKYPVAGSYDDDEKF